MPSRKFAASLAALAVAGAAVIAWAAPASAHVVVTPDRAVKGSVSQLSFLVPNESETAKTVKVEIQIPQDNPMTDVQVLPVAGWTATATTTTLSTPIATDEGQVSELVSSVTFEGGPLNAGEYQEFSLLLGPIPTEVDEIQFPTVQTYDDGTTVSWIDDATQADAEHPAPVVHLGTPPAPGTGSGASDRTKKMAIVAVLASGFAVVLAGFAVFRSTRRRYRH
jgi:uncharacterized protein YcnI